jgi:hypothetical protein
MAISFTPSAPSGMMTAGRDPELGSARPMPTYEIIFHDALRAPEIVIADGGAKEQYGSRLYAIHLVVLTPREIVVRRFAPAEVADIRQVEEHRAMLTPDGYRVERGLLQRSLRRPPRPYLRVTWRGQWIADCASPAQVAAHVDLASLNEEA